MLFYGTVATAVHGSLQSAGKEPVLSSGPEFESSTVANQLGNFFYKMDIFVIPHSGHCGDQMK